MYLKYYLLSILLMGGLISIVGISCSAQKKGFIVTNVNDTIKGKFKLAISPESAAYGAPKVFALYNSKNIKTDISTDSIKKINIVKGTKIADSYIIFQNNFWQLLAAENKLTIYRRNFKSAIETQGFSYDAMTNYYYYGNVGYNSKWLEIAIFSGKTQKVQVYSGLQNVGVTIIAKEVLQFINNRYKLNLTFKDLNIDQRTDFIHQQKLFNLILKLEDSAKIQDAPPLNL